MPDPWSWPTASSAVRHPTRTAQPVRPGHVQRKIPDTHLHLHLAHHSTANPQPLLPSQPVRDLVVAGLATLSLVLLITLYSFVSRLQRGLNSIADRIPSATSWVTMATSASTAQVQPPTGIGLLEHINVNVPAHPPTAAFYFGALGLVPDPRRQANLEKGAGTLWANIGASQIHLPAGEPQVIPGAVFLEYEDLDDVRAQLTSNGCAFQAEGDRLVAHCPYGNRFVLLPGGRRGAVTQPGPPSLGTGMAGVELRCAPGTAAGIGRFYRRYLDAEVAEGSGEVTVKCGQDQFLRYRESSSPLPPYDGHHAALYMASAEAFETAFHRLAEAGLVWVNPRFTDQAHTWADARDTYRQFRFRLIVDPDTSCVLHTLEHEVRAPNHEANPYLAR